MRRLIGLSSFGSLLTLATPSLAQDLQPPPPMQLQQQPLQPPPPMQPMQPMQPQPQPGLTPPPPMAPGSQPGAPSVDQQQKTETNQKLNEAESKDSGRNFELFYLDGTLGGSYINMAQFDSTALAVKKTSAGGPAFSIGAGLRLVVFYVGARLRYNALSSFNLVQINGELGLKLPISLVDVIIGLHGGYSFVGRLGDANQATDTSTPTSNDAVSIRGFNGGLEFGVDYFISPLFSVGAGVIGDFLLLNRPPVAKPDGFAALPAADQQKILNDPLYQKSGTSAGLELGGMLRLGLHFGL